jgi:hypothetical protein
MNYLIMFKNERIDKCRDCPFGNENKYTCTACNVGTGSTEFYYEKPLWCPLVLLNSEIEVSDGK